MSLVWIWTSFDKKKNDKKKENKNMNVWKRERYADRNENSALPLANQLKWMNKGVNDLNYVEIQ